MMRSKNGVNWRTVLLATGAGAVALGVAAQLMAKPNLPEQARAAARVSVTAGSAAPSTAADGKAAAHGTRLVADPPVRELFRPLVVPQPPAAPPALGGPISKAPKLPAIGGAAKTIAKAGAKPATAGPPAVAVDPGVTRAEDIQMLGVVQMGDKPEVLLKKPATGESHYVGKGEKAFGFTVGDISESSVDLTRDGKSSKVIMSAAITLEGPGGASTAGSPTFGGSGRSFGGGGYGSSRSSGGGGYNGGGGGYGRRNRDGSGGSGGSSASSAPSGFNVATILALPTWTERLKKLEEVKAQVDSAQYERYHKFFEEKAKEEKK